MNDIEDILADLRGGKMVIILDDEERENEGDLIMAASKVRPEDINFMAHNARGLICLALQKSRCEQLKLPLMVAANETRFSTNFTVSIEAAEGVTTGISAFDRAHTIRTAVRPDVRPEDLTQPGHVFPLMAQPGGILTRAGHTEAGTDLARLADLEPAAVLVEILNDDGSMARRPQLQAFAKRHGLKIGSIADLIRFRLKHEKTVARVHEEQINTEYGAFRLVAFRDIVDHKLHLAMVYGELDGHPAPLVRVHLPNMLSDVLCMDRDDFGMPLRVALRAIVRSGAGVAVLLGGAGHDDEVLRRLTRAETSPVRGKQKSAPDHELRTYGIGAQILAELGVRKMRVLSTPKRFTGLAGFGLEVVGYTTPENESEARESIAHG